MQKIMFNDKYGLTQAVLDGRKTMTRRIINQQTEGWLRMQYDERYDDWHRRSPYMYLETLALAQSYRSILQNTSLRDFVCQIEYDGELSDEFENITDGKGFKNKMFVKAKYMPHHIKISGIRVERLQDISNEDCLREGVRLWEDAVPEYQSNPLGKLYEIAGRRDRYKTPREAFAALIDNVSGKGTWESNPLVWVYEFELVD